MKSHYAIKSQLRYVTITKSHYAIKKKNTTTTCDNLTIIHDDINKKI